VNARGKKTVNTFDADGRLKSLNIPRRTPLYLNNSVQKPVIRAYEQSPKAVKEWREVTYSLIAAQAKAQGG